MKKALIYGLSAALLLSSLTACGKPDADQQTTEPEPPQIQATIPEAETTPEPEPEETPAVPERLASTTQELEEISHDELLTVFEQEYEISKGIYKSDSEEAILNELEMIRITVDCMEKSLPSEYETQYRNWRPSVIQQDNQNTSTPTNAQQSQPVQGSKPQGNKVSGSGQQPQGDSEDRGTTEDWSNIITDPSQIATGIDDPFKDPAEVSYGGTGPSQQPQGGADRGTTEEPSYREIITDKSQIATGIDDPFKGSAEVSYGGN